MNTLKKIEKYQQKLDKQYIVWLKNTLDMIDKPVNKINNQCFQLVDNNSLLVNGKDYKEEMIEAFIHDLTYHTKTYQYHFYDDDKSIVNESITYSLLFPNPIMDYKSTYFSSLISTSLKLHIFDLLNGAKTLRSSMFRVAWQTDNSDLLMGLLERGFDYGTVEYCRARNVANHLTMLIECYKKLITISHFTVEDIELNFIQHIKNSTIHISHSDLINIYIDIFSEKNLEKFYLALNIQEEKICVSVKEKLYFEVTLSTSALAQGQLQTYDIAGVAHTLKEKKMVFSKFEVIYSSKDYINLLIENTEMNCEKKVIMLFEELVAQKYNIDSDEKQEFKQLQSIVEKINLEYLINSSYDGNALKIKI